MQAIVYHNYGSPDMLNMEEVQKPAPKEGEILVKVVAASTAAGDWHLLRADPFLVRFMYGLLKPKYKILGSDVAGRVEAVGRNVTHFQPGDEVFGDLSLSGFGAFAEYVTAPEQALALKPTNLTFEEAAAVPVSAVTALLGLREGKIQAGQKVLINGASGGVGTFAVQIAKAFGAEVTAVCSTGKVELVRSLGAHHVIDYTKEDFTQNGQQYDLIFCAVGNRSLKDYKRALKPQGACVIAGFTGLGLLFQHMILGPRQSQVGGQRVGLMATVNSTKTDLVFLHELLQAGKVVPVIDKCYPFKEVPDALRYLETGRARGKVVITVA